MRLIRNNLQFVCLIIVAATLALSEASALLAAPSPAVNGDSTAQTEVGEESGRCSEGLLGIYDFPDVGCNNFYTSDDDDYRRRQCENLKRCITCARERMAEHCGFFQIWNFFDCGSLERMYHGFKENLKAFCQGVVGR